MVTSTLQGSAAGRSHWMSVMLIDENALPPQASSAETVPHDISRYRTPDPTIAAAVSVTETESNDVPMPDVTKAAHCPAEDRPSKESLSDNVNETVECLPSPDQSPSSPQTSEYLLNDEDQSSQASSRSNTWRQEETTLTLNEDMGVIKDMIKQVTSIFRKLSDDDKCRLLEVHPNIRTQVKNLNAAMESLSLKRPAFRTYHQVSSDTSDYNPSESGHESTTPSPSNKKSKKSNVQLAPGHSKQRISQNSNSETFETQGTLTYEVFLTICNLDLNPTFNTDARAAFVFCNSIIRSDFSNKLLKSAHGMGKKIENIAEPATNQKYDERIKAIKRLMDRVQEYESDESNPSLYIKIWDSISLANLIEPDWKKHPFADYNAPGKYVRWAYDIWTKDWIREARKNKWPKVDGVVAELWAAKLVEGRYWQQWCCFLSGGSDSRQRGALLLLLVGIIETEDRLSEPAFKLAKAFISKGLRWVPKLAAMLNPWALRMYQGLNEEEIEEFEKSLQGFSREVLKDGVQDALAEAFGDA